MKKLLLLLTLTSILFITSCELVTDEPIQGDVYYINVGIDYENNGDVKTLFGTTNDAEELHLALREVISNGSRSGTGYRMIQEGLGESGDHTYFIKGIPISNYPSKANISSLLTNHAEQTNEDDLTIFTYSGHGIETTGELVFATTTGDSPPVPSMLMNTKELLDLMTPIPGKKLIILDSCFSGMFVEASPSSTNTVLNNSIQKFFETYHSSDNYAKPDLFVLTASTHTDSYEMYFGTGANTHKHGVFSYALLEALGWSHSNNPAALAGKITYPPAVKSGRITVDGLFKYIKKNQALGTGVKLFSNWSEYQHPMTTGGPLDLVLFNL